MDKGDGGPLPAQAFSESNQANSAGAGVGRLEPADGGGSAGLVSSGTTEPPGAPDPRQLARGAPFPLRGCGEPIRPYPLPGTTAPNAHGPSAADAAKFTPSSVSPPPADDLSAVPAPPADPAAPDANAHAVSVATAGAARRPAAPLATSKPTAAAFPNAHITRVHGRPPAARRRHHRTRR